MTTKRRRGSVSTPAILSSPPYAIRRSIPFYAFSTLSVLPFRQCMNALNFPKDSYHPELLLPFQRCLSATNYTLFFFQYTYVLPLTIHTVVPFVWLVSLCLCRYIVILIISLHRHIAFESQQLPRNLYREFTGLCMYVVHILLADRHSCQESCSVQRHYLNTFVVFFIRASSVFCIYCNFNITFNEYNNFVVSIFRHHSCDSHTWYIIF